MILVARLLNGILSWSAKVSGAIGSGEDPPTDWDLWEEQLRADAVVSLDAYRSRWGAL